MTIDLNVVLGVMMTILIGLSTWTLVTVHGLAKDAAAASEKEKAQDAWLKEDRARIMRAEDNITELQLEVVSLGGKKR
jgi:hypothetical protein